jgi:uncharacterized RDD family membrane protein YckC
MEQPHPSVGQLPSYTSGSPFKGFWIRFVASIIDGIVLSILVIFLALFALLLIGSLFGEEAGFGMLLLVICLLPFAAIFDNTLMEASEYQGTFGKYLLGMKVVDSRGERITMKNSFIRTIVYMVLLAVFVGILGILMIGFTEEKQGLHCIASKTYVVPFNWQGPVPVQDGFGA